MSIQKRLFLRMLIFTSVLVGACGLADSTPTNVPLLHQLRIANTGKQDIVGLVVLFPGPTFDSSARKIRFGDIPAGTKTPYQDVPGGVYPYAAYEFFWDDRVIVQSVTDWMGEIPMDGEKFTYQIRFDIQSPQIGLIELVDVSVDIP